MIHNIHNFDPFPVDTTVNGVRFRGSRDPEECIPIGINRTFIKCPIPHAIGIPLVAFLESPSPGDDHAYDGVFLMGDLEVGAPPEWQYGGINGPMPWMQVARTDSVEFSVDELHMLIEYIQNRFDVDDGPVEVNADDFAVFQKEYGA